MTQTKHGICGLCFHSPGCGVIVHFDDEGKIDHLEPDPDVPMGEVLCPISKSARDIVYSDKRLSTPLRRTGPKGTYEFEPITWDEAYDEIAAKLNELKDKHGPESVGFYAGTGTYERSFKDAYQLKGSEIYLASSVLFPFGSPNTFGVGAPCYTSLGVLAPKVTMGCLHIDMYSDLDNADLILVWGTDPSTSTPPAAFSKLERAAEEGAEIVVIDPRRTKSADLPGAEWLPIRPGTDGALALALAHVIIRDDLHDVEFTENWCQGFEEFAEYVKDFTPEYVSELTGIDADRIEELAESIAEADGATYVMYTGLEYTKSGVQNIRAVMALWAVAGQLDVEGGRNFLHHDAFISLNKSILKESPGMDKSIGKGKFPVYAKYCGGEPHAILLPKAIIDGAPYKIRGLFIQGASILTAWPDPKVWQKAMEELDFLVCIDLQMTKDAAFADIVLPASTAFEQESYCYYGNAIRYREKMIEPVGEAKPNHQILAELAERLGYGDLYAKDPKTLLGSVLEGSGYSLDDLLSAENYVIKKPGKPMEYKKWEKGLLRKDGKPGFETPSGKFEIKSTVLEKHGYDGLPKYEESFETPVSDPDRFKKFPLILGTGPFKPDMKSCFRAIPRFMKKFPSPAIQISPADAAERRLETGDLATLKTARGSVVMRVFVTDKIMEGFVYAPVGGGGPLGTEEWQAANVNMLTDLEQFDPISGFPVYKTLLCQIKRKRDKRHKIEVPDPTLGCVG
ncbi:molybdopterin-containing oxidoreductase family protein [Desulfatibacillum aliphaticivorans]|uniref:molybdopterin-containing oxidoreductase family protein n=1 Tax=Desulfatibacillum aliphaticivorans TaxID=218208 RepID=UPI0004060D7B|nr:molybdopterin-dependent oxidoreductase [Desulfatibacillum aliphaticivorans]